MCPIVSFSNEKSTTDQKKLPLRFITSSDFIIKNKCNIGHYSYWRRTFAKSAFDVVTHSSILRKLFLTGIEGSTWKLIHDLHQETQSVIKWNRLISEPFSITQGVRM
jgi:hypothetical protein